MASLKRRTKKLTKTQALRISGTHFLICKECGIEDVQVPKDVSAVTCARCVQRMTDSPFPQKQKDDRPKGWQIRPFFEYEGQVFKRGRLVTDETLIFELREKYGKNSSKNVKPKTSGLRKKTVKSRRRAT
jgi:hypothetical protein